MPLIILQWNLLDMALGYFTSRTLKKELSKVIDSFTFKKKKKKKTTIITNEVAHFLFLRNEVNTSLV